MRYIIIPLLIILYLWWTYKSIKDLIKALLEKNTLNAEVEIYTFFRFLIHSVIICLSLLFLIIKYW